MSLDAGGSTSAAASLESTPLVANASGGDRTYTGTPNSQSTLRKKATRPFDLDATTPGETTPTGSHPNQNRDLKQPEASTRISLWEKARNSTSLKLENSGSVARDHLASERTFLAYIRTSLAIASSGVALVQLFTVANVSRDLAWDPKVHAFVRPLGAVTILVGISVMLIGVTRYFFVQTALTKGYFPAARSAMGFIALALFALVGTTFVFLITGNVGAGDV